MRSEEAKSKIHIRKVRSSDRTAVFKFCERTWSWGDYIPKVWDKWLREENGRVFVATIEGVPVGISHLSIDKPREVWLSGARTDPTYRRKGVATAITKKCLEYAKRKGAKIARLVTETDNTAAQAVVQKIGFLPMTEFVEMVKENVVYDKSKNSRWAKEDEADTIWSYLQNSETYRKAAGLYTVLYHWFSLDMQDLKRFIKQRKAIVHVNEKSEVDGLMLVDDVTAREWHENTIQTCYIDGDYNTVLDMTKLLENHCFALGIKKIYGFTPNNRQITTALEKLGFKMPEAATIVYEKKI